jgi:hypothetical protein
MKKKSNVQGNSSVRVFGSFVGTKERASFLGRKYQKNICAIIYLMEFDGPDHSWALDLKNLTDHLEKRTPLWGDIDSAMYALAQVRKAYQENGYTQLPASQ